MAYTMPEDMPKPQTLTNENDGLRALLYAAAGIIQADDSRVAAWSFKSCARG
jgi:hypothetical protein